MLTQRIEQLVGIYPQTSLTKNVQLLCETVRQELSQLGFEVTPLLYNGVHSLYAHPKGRKHSKLLLQGHIDVVPADDQPFRDAGDKLYGRGTYDMLYATACYLELLHELKDQISKLDVGLMLTGDEEFGGFNGVEKILQDGYTTDVCILPDAGEGFGSLNIAAKGVYTMVLRVQGMAHHGSRPWEGDGAAGKLVHFLTEVEKLFDTSDKQNSTMTVARMQAGDAENKGPATADCTLDIRYKDQADLVRITAGLKILLEQFNVETLEIKNGNDYQLDLENPYVRSFVQLYEQAAGETLRLTKAHGSSDARFFASRNMPVIMLRPDGGSAHGDEEWLSVASLHKFYDLLKTYILEVGIVK